MKRSNNLKYTLILFLVTITSCKKFLDQNPVSTPTDATTWKSDDDANSAVAGCYSLIRSAMDASVTYYAYGDLPTDQFNGASDGDLMNIHNVNWAISVPAINIWDPKLKLRVYTPFYASIQQSNRCLHFLNAMPLSYFTGSSDAERLARRNKYIGEALFTRAFNYFYISRVWGDVPLDTSYQSDISGFTGIPRTPQKAVLAAAISDLDIARQYLDWQDPASSNRVIRADKGAVFALMAHIYAWSGDYQNCRIACDSVITQKNYQLVNDYPSIYTGQSEEGIFEIAQNSPTEAMNATQYTGSIANYTLCAPLIPTITLPGWQIDTVILHHLFNDSNDIRYKKEFTAVNFGSQNFYSCIKYSNLQTIPTTASGNYYLLKNNIIIFRLADILLLMAEALAAQPAPDLAGATTLVNQVRTRAGTAPLGAVSDHLAMIDSVTDERGRELFLEGHRYYDLVRNDRLTGTSQFPAEIMSHANILAGKYYWPLDPSLFILNPMLTQTPYWAQLLKN